MTEPLPDASLRVLQRIADDMRRGLTGRIEIDLKSGGVAGFRELRSLHPDYLPEPDDMTRRLTA